MTERIAAYRRFVEAAARKSSDDGYLFDTPRCRFVPEPSDELVAPPGAQVVRTPSGVAVQLPGGAQLPITGVDFDKLRGVFARLPSSCARLTIDLGSQADALLEQAFGKVLFTPVAVAELETQLPAVELVRFPGSPYEVVRGYWRNSCAVRACVVAHGVPNDVQALRALLLELHELLLLGDAGADSRNSFYLPASPLGRKRPEPGAFYEVPSGRERRGTETILTSGARVAAPLVGGANYWQLLAESVEDPAALEAERHLQLDGLDWGQLVLGRAEDETEARSWFLPPRPLAAEHFAGLLADLQKADAAEKAADTSGVLAALATFHQRFVRVHPLPSGNQSIAMSFVNAALVRVLGGGIPHLVLDQLALRFDVAAYQRLFARAARVWSAWSGAASGVSPAERLRQQLRMRAELNDFVAALASSATLLEARALMSTRPEGAELALLLDR